MLNETFSVIFKHRGIIPEIESVIRQFNAIYRSNLLLMLFTSIDLNFMDILLKSKNINS